MVVYLSLNGFLVKTMFANWQEVEHHREVVCNFFGGGAPNLSHVYDIAVAYYKDKEFRKVNMFRHTVKQAKEMADDMQSEGKAEEHIVSVLLQFYNQCVVDEAMKLLKDKAQ